jgi:hypothetical protein
MRNNGMECQYRKQDALNLFSVKPLFSFSALCMVMIFLCMPALADVPSCAAVFPQGMQSNKNGGKINFDWNAQLLGSSTSALLAKHVEDEPNSVLLSCGTARCSASANHAAEWDIDINSGSSTVDIQVLSGTNQTLGANAVIAFRKITIGESAQATFASNTSDYRIKEIIIAKNAVLNLMPGSYWVDHLQLAESTKINVLGTGTARIFVKQKLNFPFEASANMQSENVPYSSSKLFIYSEGDISLQTNVQVSSTLYTKKQLSLSQSNLYGSASFHKAYLGDLSKIHYENNAIANTHFNGLCSTSIVSPPPSNENQCLATFSNGLQLHEANNTIAFDYNAQLHNAASIRLNAYKVTNNNGSNKLSCVTEKCLASGQSVGKLETAFQATSSNLALTVPWLTTRIFGGDTEREFGKVTVATSATLELRALMLAYKIKKMDLGYRSTLKIPAGDYWVENLSLGSEANIEVIGAGTARFFVKDKMSVPNKTSFNKNTANSANLVLYTYNDLDFNANSQAYGMVYSKARITLNYQSNIFGAVTGSAIKLDSDSHVTYKADAVSRVDFGALCESTTLPDLVAPQLIVNPIAAEVSTGTLTITGTAIDPEQEGSGIASVIAKTAQGAQITANLNGDIFSVTAPLALGVNIINIEARDFSGNITTVPLSVKRTSLATLNNIVPVAGTVFTSSPINISGEVRTAWPQAQVQFYVNSLAQTLVTKGAGVYSFSATSLNLIKGNNIFALRAVTPDGNTEQNLTVVYSPSEDTTAPKITLNPVATPTENSSVTLGGTVTDNETFATGVANLVLRKTGAPDLAIVLTGDAFSISPALNLGDNIFTLIATDNAGNQSQQIIAIKRTSLPRFASVTPVDGTSVTVPNVNISGSVQTAWPLTSIKLSLNGRVLVLTPTQTGSYGFAIQNEPLTLGVNVFDLSIETPDGNVTQLIHITYAKPDRDGDGHPDDEDAFPDDATEWTDLDHDGIGDNSDTDRDGDGISNDYETQIGTNPNDATSKPVDRDGDGIPDALDLDRDGDGHTNDQDKFPDDASEWADLDADAIGDNSDTDRDGDGFSNDIETQKNTNPNDKNDYPDTVAPALQLTNAANEHVDAEQVLLRGTASDPVQPHSGIVSLIIRSDRYPNTPFEATLDGELFQLSLPLTLGINNLTLVATDVSGNHTEVTHAVQRISPARFQNITPANGTVIRTKTVTIAGEVHTQLPLEAVQFFMNESSITPSTTSVVGVYRFNLPNITLTQGSNAFLLRAETADGSDQYPLSLTYLPHDAENLPAPVLSIISPVSGSQLNEQSFKLKGRVISQSGPMVVTVNGFAVSATSLNQQDYYFETLLQFPNNQDSLAVDISATDSLTKRTQLHANYRHDGSAPQFMFNNIELKPSPELSYVLSSPFVVQGSVSDNNLASITLNDQPIVVQPNAVAGRYDFTVPVAIEPGAEHPLVFTALDQSGNRTQVTYTLKSAATANITPLLPSEGAELINTGTPIVVQTAARLSAVPSGSRVMVKVGAQEIALNLAGTLANGDVTLPAHAGDYTFIYQVLDANQAVIATSSRRVQVRDEQAVAVELVRHEPESAAINIEPNQPIELYFNKAIDPSKLSIAVTETLHGDTYLNLDESGLNFLSAEGYQLKHVDRDNEAVAGGLSLLPGTQSAAFYPSRQFGFHSEVFVAVTYNNQELAHFSFTVRRLPTFVTGAVSDQFGQPLAGVSVTLPDVNRRTTTNGDGAFAFGFQEQPGNEIPGGRHQLVINGDLSFPGFGNVVRGINLQEGRQNTLTQLHIPELNRDIPFQLISGGQALVNLAGTDVQLELSSSRLLFNKGRASGDVQLQFMPFEHLHTKIMPGALPQWLFAGQPQGIRVEGPVGIAIKMPALSGNYDYIPYGTVYVVLLGYNPEHEVIEPIGIGKIESHRVASVGKVALTTLDYLGYAIVDPKHQALLQQVAEGKQSLQQLQSALTR